MRSTTVAVGQLAEIGQTKGGINIWVNESAHSRFEDSIHWYDLIFPEDGVVVEFHYPTEDLFGKAELTVQLQNYTDRLIIEDVNGKRLLVLEDGEVVELAEIGG